MSKEHQIATFLNELEKKENIVIFHAVESGSRAWGFPSTNSDYDVRFIYHRELDWYLTVFNKKDHIDLAFCNDLDVGGWDLGKCLRLLYKGNAVIHEWVRSPVVYRSKHEKVVLLRQLAAQAFNPQSVYYHYISLAKKKLLSDSTQKNAKSFLYALRALLCAKWVAQEREAPPVEFAKVVERYIVDDQLNRQLADLLEKKSVANEEDDYLVPEQLWEFAIDAYNEKQNVGGIGECDQAMYDNVLKAICLA